MADQPKVAAKACTACSQPPHPSYTLIDIRGVGIVPVCSDPTYCRRRAEELGVWCR